FIEAELQTPAHGFGAVGQPFAEHSFQVFYLRPAVQTDYVHINAVILFQIGGGEQVRHQGVGIDTIGFRHDHQTGRIFVVGFVAQVGNQRQFFRVHLRGDLFQHLGTGGLVRQRGNHNIAVFDGVHGAHFYAATAIAVDFTQVGPRGNNFRFGGKIRGDNVLAQSIEAGVGVIQQVNTGTGDFADIVRRNIGGHAHGNTGGAVQ